MSENNTNQTQTQAQTQAEPEITLTLTPDELQEENQKQLADLEAKKAAEEDEKLKSIDPIEATEFSDAEKRQSIPSHRRSISWIPIQFSSMVLLHRRK